MAIRVKKDGGNVVLLNEICQGKDKSGLGVAVKGDYMRKDIDKIVVVVAEVWPSWCWIFQIMNWVKIIVLVKHKLVYKGIWKVYKSCVTHVKIVYKHLCYHV